MTTPPSSSGNFHERCVRFSALIIGLATELPKSATNRIIADQLVRSGTSVGANVHEARGAESRADFIHKFKVALKEARETTYWLEVIRQAQLTIDPNLEKACREGTEIGAILTKSVLTAERNLRAEQAATALPITSNSAL